MTIEQFAEITRRIILKDGTDEFLPTALYPGRSEIVALDKLPESDDSLALAVEWAASRARDREEFLLAVLVNPSEFVVAHRNGDKLEERRFSLSSPAV